MAAAEGDEDLYDRYIDRMKKAAADDPQEEARFRQALVSFERPELVRRTTDAIFSDLIGIKELPPGPYVLRATITASGQAARVLTRAFEIR